MRPTWDEYFKTMVHHVASRSPCLKRQVGAVLVKDKRVLATGYNGPLSGVPHCEGKCQAMEVPGRKYDNCPSVHAEANAVAQAAKYGISIEGAIAYVSISPCWICNKLLKAAGVSDVVVVDKTWIDNNKKE